MLPLIEPWDLCPTCAQDTAWVPLHVQRDRKSPLVAGPYYALLGCQRCGLVFVSPRPAPEALARYYVDEAREGWTVRHTEAHAEFKRQKKQELAARMLAPLLAARGRALDIGCGAGDILTVLQEAGWRTTGIEPHTALRALAAERHELVTEIPRTPTFDLIVLNHVLEHVLSPRDLLRDARRAGMPGAHLLVSVPAFEQAAVTGNLTRACGPIHINGFTRAALRNTAAMAGWAAITPAGAKVLDDRHILYAVAGEPEGPEPGALDAAVDVLRRYGRRLDKTGEFVGDDVTQPV